MHCSLMSSLQPALEQSGHSICKWQEVVSNISIFTDYPMDVSSRRQPCISSPAVCSDNSAWLNELLHSSYQTLRRGIEHPLKTNSSDPFAVLLCYNEYQCFTCGAATTIYGPFSTNVSFVDFYSTRKTITIWSHHCSTQFVQPGPSSMVTPQTKNPLEAQSADTVFLVNNVPNRPEPNPQRLSGILKNSSRCYRGLNITISTPVKTPLGNPRLPMTAPGTYKTFWPAQVEYILSAGFLGGETLLKIKNCLWIVFHTHIYYI